MRARLKDLSFTRDGDSVLSITTKEDCRELWDNLYETDVEVSIKPYKTKRGLSANALYWSTLTELARKLGYSNAAMHNIMLRKYGWPEKYDEQIVYIMLPDTEEAEKKALEADTYHLRPTGLTKPGRGGPYRAYMLMRGSSTYNTQEFSRLLDGLLEDAKEAGIHVRTDKYE